MEQYARVLCSVPLQVSLRERSRDWTTPGGSPPSGSRQMVCIRRPPKNHYEDRRKQADARAATESCVRAGGCKRAATWDEDWPMCGRDDPDCVLSLGALTFSCLFLCLFLCRTSSGGRPQLDGCGRLIRRGGTLAMILMVQCNRMKPKKNLPLPGASLSGCPNGADIAHAPLGCHSLVLANQEVGCSGNLVSRVL